MVLYGDGLAVAHVTLHMALRDVFRHLSTESVLERVRLLHDLLPRLIDRAPRIAVAALNPHASDGGLFGDEERTLLAPAVARHAPKGSTPAGRSLPTRCSSGRTRASSTASWRCITTRGTSP